MRFVEKGGEKNKNNLTKSKRSSLFLLQILLKFGQCVCIAWGLQTLSFRPRFNVYNDRDYQDRDMKM